MQKGRLEAFSDGVIAVVITIMVLELKAPHAQSLEQALSALHELGHTFLAYVLSFIYVGIYWNNHHHIFHVTDKINGRVLWLNLHLLFWLSLFPFVTSWLSESPSPQPLPTALYGFVLLMAAVAWPLMLRELITINGRDSTLAQAIGSDLKGKLSIVAYVLAIGLAFVEPWISCVLYVAVAATWFLPDRRIESRVIEKPE
jgi:uncharacterized membrane protein